MDRGLAVVVGAGPGLGRALARRLAADGFVLALVLRPGEDLERFAPDPGWPAGPAHLFRCDAGDAPGMAAVLGGILALGLPVELLVYNASRAQEGLPSALDADRLHEDFETSALGALRCAQAVLPGMRARSRGTLLFTGGGSALHPKPAQAGLGLAKGLLRTLALLLAEELEPEGIHAATVTIGGFIQPGGPLDPDRLAEAFLGLHREPRGRWRRELVLP